MPCVIQLSPQEDFSLERVPCSTNRGWVLTNIPLGGRIYLYFCASLAREVRFPLTDEDGDDGGNDGGGVVTAQSLFFQFVGPR